MNLKKLLPAMSLPGSLGKKVPAALVFDVHGRRAVSYEYVSKENLWQPSTDQPDPDLPRPCIMVLPSAMIALCRTQTPNKEQKDAAAALDVEAGQKLFRSPETGGREIRFYGGGQGIDGTLCWVSNEYLHQCLETAKEMGFQVASIVQPELDLKTSKPTLLVSCEDGEIRICCMHKHVPLNWQVLPEGGPSFESALGVVLAELESERKPKPEKIVLWSSPGNGGKPEGFDKAIEKLLPEIPLQKISSHEELLASLRLNHIKGSFHESLEEWERIPLTPKDYIRPGLGFVAAVAGCLLLFFSVIHLNNQDAAVLKGEAHKIMFLAKRTDLVTMEVREFVRRNRDILKYTVKKPFVSHVFRDLGDAVPAQVKLNTMRLGQSGRITLQGEAKSEISLMSLLENLSSTEIFTNAVLSSMTKLEHGQGFRFVVELEFPEWEEFFKPKKQGAVQ
ncbi:PilN domain-containing protein [Desulfovibrio sp. JC010]|uniref:PilN domain-containing protein n=1 Tax=Desulfovibrio sp. JC010 TaxID=2593641 RepID=UPI0013D52212|nr:PilN domain-containing protein [Desulfovibrio sp. JC010]NDV27659.1 PilN domain-containing protein [Desulfovibrio sp. JC010]